MAYRFSLKVIVVGDYAVGKTSLCKRFALKSFSEDYKPTMGVDIYSGRLVIPELGVAQLNIWDTAGQERFRRLYPKYYAGARAALVVYDITSKQTFKSVPEWVESVRKYAGDIPIVLVGNKADLQAYRQVSQEEGLEMSRYLGLEGFYEASARLGLNVDESFRKATISAIKRLLRRVKNGI